LLITVLTAVPAGAQPPAGAGLGALQDKALKAAVQQVAPCVVQIETSGGSDLLAAGPFGPPVRKGLGPTTGLILSPDGYIISSSFNFANKPSAIFVTVPQHKERFVAQVVARDLSRMLTLLKITATGLPVPTPAPKKEIQVGQTALALGRTWASADSPPSVSIGIVSALERIWGKALQTDAKVSPVNYGGPLVDIQGRVLGVLVPASPRGQDEIAGIEWYDSGIGFAIPLEDVNAVLPRLKQGKDLERGILGITLQSADIYGAAPVIASLAPDSAAARAGIQVGDAVLEVAGVPIVRQAQILHVLGSKYEGDVVAVKVKRGAKELDFPNLKLTGPLTGSAQPFLGILPVRDDPELGVEIRYVYPKSPAESAGIKPGDRILTLGQGKETPKPFSGRDELLALLSKVQPGSEVKVEVRRQGTKELTTVTFKTTDLTDAIPDQVPEPATLKKALMPRKSAKPKAPTPPRPAAKDEKKEDAKKKAETGLLRRSSPAGDHQYWIYVPPEYDPNIAYALIVWLHPPGKSKDKDIDGMLDIWEDFCQNQHIILLGPQAQNETGWLASEADAVRDAIQEVLGQYTIDRQRIIAHGMGVGGQMAFYLGFHARDLIRGVATTGAVLTTQPLDSIANQRLSFFVAAGDKDPLVKSIREVKPRLAEKKYPVAFREMANLGHQYFDPATLAELVRWIDTLDRE
jgi:S1-C subfamily serine protease/predicted esterase